MKKLKECYNNGQSVVTIFYIMGRIMKKSSLLTIAVIIMVNLPLFSMDEGQYRGMIYSEKKIFSKLCNNSIVYTVDYVEKAPDKKVWPMHIAYSLEFKNYRVRIYDDNGYRKFSEIGAEEMFKLFEEVEERNIDVQNPLVIYFK